MRYHELHMHHRDINETTKYIPFPSQCKKDHQEGSTMDVHRLQGLGNQGNAHCLSANPREAWRGWALDNHFDAAVHFPGSVLGYWGLGNVIDLKA